ncbi:pyridoxamine 5'-phosphate oxidase family protein [Sinomonas notoginsengisoli]|uniref:pyridoxamine 5'-phosphate oxidase family protein n=1 Tax=Sinomonas notoginsengisoli TaxID=1457311 RepID=UPI001F413FFC|nr:pyridoxamine 5'-phosphate oxidase family protein [Sinomonas notoginsengisoli]
MSTHESRTNPTQSEGVRNLSPEDAWDRTRTMVVGRLAFSGGDRIELFPINYLVDRGTVLFRTAPGTKLAASMEHLPVVFEVDGYEAEANEAWSVVVHGVLEPVLDTSEIVEAVALPLFPWQSGEKAFFVRIVPAEVTGRQFRVADPSRWVSQFTGGPRASAE